MLKKTVQDILNKQINEELYSAYLYLAMSAYFESENLPGFAHWMRVQAKEETTHALKIFDHIHERGGTVELASLKQPPKEWKDPLDAIKGAYAHEVYITQKIHELTDLAASQKDPATHIFLHWFVQEQVEEEKNADALVQKLSRISGAPAALVMMDHELSQRK
ncbi:ferritin [Candidatus Woesearchaeota archaeon CG_4_10_14_0_8_um_filter_47_5]|nr:MAG: ferritin [Candidatus Woesearchaeota archaeon CG_4_10_14_0_8_um_filter_47_5]